MPRSGAFKLSLKKSRLRATACIPFALLVSRKCQLEQGAASRTSQIRVIQAQCGACPEVRLFYTAHPRYQNSWTVLQDAQKRNLVPTPEYSGIGVSASLSPLDSSCDSAFTSPDSASSSLELRCRGTLNIQLFPKASCISQHLARRTDQGGYALARHAARDAETL